MAILKKSKWKAPFFGKSNNYSTGRDSLGLQTTSQASYATLLPGLTNLTNRIRYYGFYCWLLEVYAKQIGIINPAIQNKFIRRGEYQIALLMQQYEKETVQIPGSLFATNELNKNQTSDILDLQLGADVEKGKNTYWKYASGAFGQYYSGALQAIGLMIHKDEAPVFVCTESENTAIVTGTILAEAFAKNIPDTIKEIFLSNIHNGFLKKSDSKKLYEAFSMTYIPRDSEEWELYTKLLFSNDKPLLQHQDNETYFRKESMLSVLAYIDQNTTTQRWHYFSKKIYQQKGKDFLSKETASSLGWYYYQLNEYWHFSIETIFWSLLKTLSNNYFQVELTVFLEEFHTTFLESLQHHGFIQNKEQKLQEIIATIDVDIDIWELSQQIQQNVKEVTISRCLYLGFQMVLVIYKQNQHELKKLKQFAALHSMERDGDCISGLQEFSEKLDIPVTTVVEKLILKYLINRHQEVAYKKMGSGTKNTLKFSYEDNFIKHIETIEPVWTTPRIYAMYHFFEDLGYVTKDNKISTTGKAQLEARV